MRSVALTNAQARRFLLRHHGLIGERRFVGKAGVLAYVRQCGCVQFDPIDVCGKNPELVFQSRVKGFTKAMLDELLYKDRQLVDYFDKNLAILPVEDWPYFARERDRYSRDGRSFAQVEAAADQVRALLKTRQCVQSGDLDMSEKVDWAWSPTRLSRAVLESLYFRGELCIHHKEGALKHYAPARRLLPPELLDAPDPHAGDDAAFRNWRTLRRVGAVGLLWQRASDAYLCMDEHKGGGRTAAFADLIAADQLIQVRVEGLDEPLYARRESEPLLDEILAGATYAPRTELLAPLDCFLWDRRLIQRLFGFQYTWEIYTPQAKRQYGYYVLPLLRGEGFVGRAEVVADRQAGVLRLRGVWWEGRPCMGELRKCLRRFAAFNSCKEVEICCET